MSFGLEVRADAILLTQLGLAWSGTRGKDPTLSDLSVTAQEYGAWKMTERRNSGYARHLQHDALQIVVRLLKLC
jgi:hypothetical protein